MSNYINKNISIKYFNNEKKLRQLLKLDIDKIKNFYDTEESLLNNAYNEIENNYKFHFNLINKIPSDLLVKDYITFYLQNYNNSIDIYIDNSIDNYNIDDIYHKLIELLIELRFNEENIIIKANNKIKNLLIKIIWIESNVNYILNIIKIIERALLIFDGNKDKLYKMIKKFIFAIEKRNSDHTKQVNECYYLLLASICYCITSDEMQLIERNDNKINSELKIDINNYYDILKEINNIL